MNDPMQHPEIQKHIRKALVAHQCTQCQYPWFDGICSCGKWGEEEKRIQELAVSLLGANDKEFRRILAEASKKEIAGIDANLKSVEELLDLWK
jgi:hypothetical protein